MAAALVLVAAALLEVIDLLAGPERAVVPPIRLESSAVSAGLEVRSDRSGRDDGTGPDDQWG
ncbi:MAG: hypothetical protein M3P96_05245 [Actinomycetota bacterium]|nr:hypothetical protein [Actinomycetota bacterium]